MDSSKPFLVKNILEMEEDSNESHAKDIKIEDENAQDLSTDDADTVDEVKEAAQEATGNTMNRRKVRRCFRAEQLEYLERCFVEAIYPEASMRKRIAQELKVSNDRVQVWFQNRRAKARKHWKQQFCNPNVSRIPSGTTSKPPLTSDLHMRFASPFLQCGQVRREIHLHRFERRNSMVAIPSFEEQRALPPPPMTMCSCCPVQRSMGHFKPYEPRLSHSPPPPPPPPPPPVSQRHCHCLPLRPRPSCMP